MKRCKWVNLNNPNYVKYHDFEWGVCVYDDNKLFEMLLLESFQAGLSWECILNKRESFRKAFSYFDYNKICEYDDKKINELCNDKSIVRNRNKIIASVNNARIFKSIVMEYGSFSSYIWGFTGGKVIKNTNDVFNTTNSLSDIVSSDLRKRGMKYVGSTIIYSYLQSIGIIFDHELNCCCYK